MTVTTLTNDLLGEMVYQTTLPTGLEVFVMPKPGYRRKYSVYAAKYGSIDNAFKRAGESEVIKVPDGIAHFLEHKLFEGEDVPVFERFARFGANVNAFTSYTITAYLFSTTNHFAECLKELMRFVENPFFTDASVEKEKGIIEQEIRMYEDNPGRKVYTNLLRALYHRNPVRVEIGGSVESVRAITKENISICYDTFYHPTNMGLFVVGDFKPEEVFEIVKNAHRWNRDGCAPVERVYPDEPETVKDKYCEAHLKVSRPLCYVGFKDTITGLSGRDLLHRQLLTNTLLKMVLSQSSQLYDELYQEGIIDDSFSFQYSACSQYAFTIMGGETRDPEVLVRRLADGLRKYAETGVDKENFARTQRKAIGDFFHAFNSLEYVANGFLSNYFRGILLFDYADVLASLQVADINRRLQDFVNEDSVAVSVVLPS